MVDAGSAGTRFLTLLGGTWYRQKRLQQSLEELPIWRRWGMRSTTDLHADQPE